MLLPKKELLEYLEKDNLIGIIMLETYIGMFKLEFSKHVSVMNDVKYKEEILEKVFYILQDEILDNIVDLGIDLSLLNVKDRMSIIAIIDNNFKMSLNNYLIDSTVVINDDYKQIVERIYKFIYNRITDICRAIDVIGINDKPLLGKEIFNGVLVYSRIDTKLKLAVYGDATWRKIPNI